MSYGSKPLTVQAIQRLIQLWKDNPSYGSRYRFASRLAEQIYGTPIPTPSNIKAADKRLERLQKGETTLTSFTANMIAKLIGVSSLELEQRLFGAQTETIIAPPESNFRIEDGATGADTTSSKEADMAPKINGPKAMSGQAGDIRPPVTSSVPSGQGISTAGNSGDLTPQNPEYWLNLGLTDLAKLSDVDDIALLTFPLATLATLARRFADRDRLISDFTCRLSLLSSPMDQKQAALLLKIAQFHAFAGNTIATQTIIHSFARRLSEKDLHELGIWGGAPGGIANELFESSAKGFLAANKIKEAREALRKLGGFAKQRALNLPDEGRWRPSEAFISLKCRMNAVDEALAHFKWMCKHGYRSDDFFHERLIGLGLGLMNQERWNEAVALLEYCAYFLSDRIKKVSLWLAWFHSAPLNLPLSEASRIVDGITRYIRMEPRSYERARLMAELARAYAKQKMTRAYNHEINKARGALDDLQKDVAPKDVHDRLQHIKGAIDARLNLAHAYHQADNLKAAQSELTKILKVIKQQQNQGFSILLDDLPRKAADLLAVCGRFDEAIELALHESIPFVSTSILGKLLDEKMFLKLRQVYDSMSPFYFRLIFLTSLSLEFKRRSESGPQPSFCFDWL